MTPWGFTLYTVLIQHVNFTLLVKYMEMHKYNHYAILCMIINVYIYIIYMYIGVLIRLFSIYNMLCNHQRFCIRNKNIWLNRMYVFGFAQKLILDLNQGLNFLVFYILYLCTLFSGTKCNN